MGGFSNLPITSRFMQSQAAVALISPAKFPISCQIPLHYTGKSLCCLLTSSKRNTLITQGEANATRKYAARGRPALIKQGATASTFRIVVGQHGARAGTYNMAEAATAPANLHGLTADLVQFKYSVHERFRRAIDVPG